MATATERYQQAVARWAVSTATVEDTAGILEIDRTVVAGATDRAGRIAAAIADGRCLVAREAGVAGAPLSGFAITDHSLFERPFLSLLIVAADARRQGVGSALLQQVIAETRGDRLFTSTNESNVPMRMLAGRLGFVASGYIENLDDGDPELIYIRWLNGAGPAIIPAPSEPPE
ncbi:MAG TPA: GNAT family N-acetyltransferase [Thermomicrobiales bacterium]|jgi:GNAT superfamily N-acetyltransferase|nr:GNAT family N-acetyltransferase [Thermomicrobiales bacterium]